jgi:hypothetical protein
MKFLTVLLIALCCSTSALAQHVLTGTVRESTSREVIPGASIALLGTSRGAKANSQGSFRLNVDASSVRLRVSAIGYRPDTISLSAPYPTSIEVLLDVAPISGSEVTVTADQSRVEARRIMRKVIETKDTWQPLIENYSFDVYARLNARSIKGGDTSILSIIESIAKGYWDRDRGYAERIIARKQTANLPASANAFSLLGIVNFYDERIQLPDYDVVSPVARDAFDRYDYDLLGTVEINGSNSYKILVEPRGSIVPAFEGILYVDQSDYTLTYLSLTPNKAVKIGPLRDGRIEQSFRFIENKFWMPAESKFFIKAEFALPVVPAFTVEHVAVLQNYSVNQGVPDSVFAGYGRNVDLKADSVSALAWSEMRVIPLNPDELRAYNRLDSVAALPRQEARFSPLNALISLALGGTPYSFNRVEGSRFEIGTSMEKLGKWPLAFEGRAAYGVSDERFKYDLSFTQALLWTDVKKVQTTLSSSGDFVADIVEDIRPLLSIRGRMYDDLERRGNAYSKIENSFNTLVFRTDYPDYYNTRGAYGELLWTPTLTGEYSLRFLNERQESVQKNTDFAFFNKSKGQRVNPIIKDGLYRALEVQLSHRILSGLRVTGEGVLADSSFGSNFTFSSVTGSLEYETRQPAIGKTTLRLSASTVLSGIPQAQHLFSFEGRNVYFSRTHVFRTMTANEFEGDRAWSAMFEQNFFDLPVRALGLDFLEPLDLHWIGFVNAGQTTLSQETKTQLVRPAQSTGKTPYIEAGFGVANIYNIVRFDAAWRLTHRRESNGFLSMSFGISF